MKTAGVAPAAAHSFSLLCRAACGQYSHLWQHTHMPHVAEAAGCREVATCWELRVVDPSAALIEHLQGMVKCCTEYKWHLLHRDLEAISPVGGQEPTVVRWGWAASHMPASAI